MKTNFVELFKIIDSEVNSKKGAKVINWRVLPLPLLNLQHKSFAAFSAFVVVVVASSGKSKNISNNENSVSNDFSGSVSQKFLVFFIHGEVCSVV